MIVEIVHLFKKEILSNMPINLKNDCKRIKRWIFDLYFEKIENYLWKKLISRKNFRKLISSNGYFDPLAVFYEKNLHYFTKITAMQILALKR